MFNITENTQYVVLTANSGILIAAVFAIGVSVALPGIVYTTAVGLALELEFPTLERALGLVALVAAVVGPVANRHGRRAVAIRALEHTRSAGPVRTAR